MSTLQVRGVRGDRYVLVFKMRMMNLMMEMMAVILRVMVMVMRTMEMMTKAERMKNVGRSGRKIFLAADRLNEIALYPDHL